MTTLEIVLSCIYDSPCDDARTFCAEHPDPDEAISAALAQVPDLPSGSTPGRHFLRFAVLCLSEPRYLDIINAYLDPFGADSGEVAEKCAKFLRNWLHNVSMNR